ncbi:MAG: MinD/ParA family protein [Candidatus Hadarchaeales archaeon]
MVKKSGTVIGVFSAKGGTGKTTVAVNLSMALAEKMKEDVILVETNVMVSSLGVYFGIMESQVSIQDIVSGKVRPEDAIVRYGEKLDVLPGALGFVKEFGIVDMSALIEPLRKRYDIIMLDSSPGFGVEVHAGMKACDEILIISQPEIPSLLGAIQTYRMAEEWKIPVMAVVVNRYRGKDYEIPISDIKKTFRGANVFVIPEDDKVPESVAKGIPVVLSAPDSPAALEFNRLARGVLAHIKSQKQVKYLRKRDIWSKEKPQKPIKLLAGLQS